MRHPSSSLPGTLERRFSRPWRRGLEGSERVLSDLQSASKTDVGGRTIRCIGCSSCDPVAIAVRPVTEKRSALHHARLASARALRIYKLCIRRVLHTEPIRAPFPSVAGDRPDSEAVGWEGIHGTGASIALLTGVNARKFSLPDVAEVLASRPQLVPPRIELLFETPARRIFPLSLRGKSLSTPVRKRNGVVPGDMHDGVIGSAGYIRSRSFRCIPICARHLAPPWGTVNHLGY
jgi:hypothetical protein